MMGLNSTAYSSSVWTVRKLLICFTIWLHPRRTDYTIMDFVYPIRYPRSIRTGKWEVVQIYKCLHNLESLGVEIVEERIDPLLFNFAGIKSPKSYAKKVQKKMGLLRENIVISGPELSDSFSKYFHYPRFLSFKLRIDRKMLAASLRSVCMDIFKGPTREASNWFGEAFTQKVFERFFRTMTSRQGDRIQFNLGSLIEEGNEISDEFIDSFQTHFPYEYKLWERGVYDILFYWYLIRRHLKKGIAIEALRVQSDQVSIMYGESDTAKWLGFDQVPLVASIHFSLPEKAAKTSSLGSNRISLIEVERSENEYFLAYVNEEYGNPIRMSKRNLSGALIYEVATKGFAPLRDYQQAFEYVSRDRRFRLFTQSKTHFSKILDLDDGVIIPSSDVQIRITHT